MLLCRVVGNMYVLLGNLDVGGGVTKPIRMMWKPVKRSTQGVDKSMTLTSCTKGEGMIPSSKVEFVFFYLDEYSVKMDVGDGVPKCMGDVNLGILCQ